MLENLDEVSDEKVWYFARSHAYTIVTKDSDFNDIAIYKGTPPKIIWIKVGNCKVAEIEKILSIMLPIFHTSKEDYLISPQHDTFCNFLSPSELVLLTA
jgi:predicted nuclease of predicted toxin-antitoxin system